MSSQESYAAYKKRKYLSRVATKKRIKPTYVSRKYPLYKSMGSSSVHTLTKCCNIPMRSTVNGYSFDVGLGVSRFFCIFFTNQSVTIQMNSSNYSQIFVPGYSDLAALFDEVFIERVEIIILTGPDPPTGGTGSTAFGAAQIILARDYNDKNAPTAIGDVQQYFDMRVLNMANMYTHRYTVKPKMLTYSLDSTGTSVSSTPKRGYVRSNLDVDHYGIKGAFVNTSTLDQIHNYNFKFVYKCKTCK